MTSPQVTPETQEKPKTKLQQKVTAPMLLSIVVAVGLSAAIKYPIRQYFKTNQINSQVQELLQIPAFSALKKADPLFYSQLESDIKTSLNAGESTENQKKIISTAIAKAFPKYAAQASDDALLGWTQSFQKILQDPQACKSQLETGSTGGANSKLEEDLVAGMGQIIESGASGQTPPTSDPNQIQKNLATIQTNVRAIHGDRVALMQNSETMKQDTPKSCTILKDFYGEITKLPKPESGAILRELLGKGAAS